MGKLKFVIAKGMKILLNPSALRNCKIDKKAAICAQCELNDTVVGAYSYLGYRCFTLNTEIGKFCSVAANCFIGGPTHPIEYVSSSPVFHEGGNILKKHFSEFEAPETPKTIIENDVWIGQGAFIKAGVKIGTGAVIGMGSVVTHDVGAYEIWAGNPARFIRKRFDDDTVAALIKSEWWNFDDEQLHEYAKYFNSPERFIRILNERNGK